MIVTQGSIFIDPGATAFDQEDGDVTSSIVVTGAVDTSVIGEYVLTYTAMDYWKQANKADRTVIVKELTPVVEEKITVVPTDAPCTAYLNKFILPNRKNDKDEVKKLQKFLNDKFKAVLVVDGIYGKKSISEVKKFQEANADLILKPWATDNSVLRGTGLVYMTTIRVINNIMCPTLNLPLPEKLVPISENLDLKQ